MMLNLPAPYYVDGGNNLCFDGHEAQKQIMCSHARITLALAGTQSGKTVLGPWWMLREIHRQGPGDYLVAAPSYPLMQKKVIPEYTRLFRGLLGLGEYRAADRIFRFTAAGNRRMWGSHGEVPTQVFFGHAADAESLESATAKAAWLDEAGQKRFRLDSWEAIRRRLAIHQGRVLITTTPYTLGWLKSELHDKAGQGEVELIQFDSIANPAFPRAEYEAARARMPGWKFRMMYQGRFERPAGMIYDCFDRSVHLVPRFHIPDNWPRFLGLDFGGANTAGVFLAQEPGTKRYVAYREYHAGGQTAGGHASALMQNEPRTPIAYGGAKSEGQWRWEFAGASLPVMPPPVSDVEVGIGRVYAMLKARAELRLDTPYLEIMDDLTGLIDEVESYSRVLDDLGEPTEKIEHKETYHRLDGLRYIGSALAGNLIDHTRI